MTMPATPIQAGAAVGLGERDAGERRPRAGEQVPEVLADRDAEVAVEGLEDDVDRLLPRRAGARLGGDAGQVGHQERPADQAEELHERREHAGDGGHGQQRAVGVADRARQEHHRAARAPAR